MRVRVPEESLRVASHCALLVRNLRSETKTSRGPHSRADRFQARRVESTVALRCVLCRWVPREARAFTPNPTLNEDSSGATASPRRAEAGHTTTCTVHETVRMKCEEEREHFVPIFTRGEGPGFSRRHCGNGMARNGSERECRYECSAIAAAIRAAFSRQWKNLFAECAPACRLNPILI